MRIELKKLIDKKWKPVMVEELIDTSLARYMAQCQEPMVAGIYLEDDDEKPSFFIANRNKYVLMCGEKGVSMHAKDMIDLIGTRSIEPVVGYSFKGSSIVDIKKI